MPGEMPPGIGLGLLLGALVEHWMITLSFMTACLAALFGLVKGVRFLLRKSKINPTPASK